MPGTADQNVMGLIPKLTVLNKLVLLTDFLIVSYGSQEYLFLIVVHWPLRVVPTLSSSFYVVSKVDIMKANQHFLKSMET